MPRAAGMASMPSAAEAVPMVESDPPLASRPLGRPALYPLARARVQRRPMRKLLLPHVTSHLAGSSPVESAPASRSAACAGTSPRLPRAAPWSSFHVPVAASLEVPLHLLSEARVARTRGPPARCKVPRARPLPLPSQPRATPPAPAEGRRAREVPHPTRTATARPWQRRRRREGRLLLGSLGRTNP